VSVFAISRSLV